MSSKVVTAENQVALSPKKEIVKSTAVVEWSATRFPVQFSKLSLNTNINDTPANWLRSQSSVEQHLRDLTWQREHSEFSSFLMANSYPDYAGEVDVISDAENIKKLLKMPFLSTSHISIMVHRVGRTLLLDDFDIHKHLLRKESENWSWMKQFFNDTILKNEEEMEKFNDVPSPSGDNSKRKKCVPRKSKKRDVIQNRIMYSKFLYHSITGSSGQELELSHVDRTHQVSPTPINQLQHFVADIAPSIDMFGSQEFNRQTLWTFEDLRMLIGTDLPIFSVGDHPCVSLRLRDAEQPINVVTGLDYWLDNLMCNVPEVAMCYHDNGFVKKYELVKTEDIPKLDGSKFDPQLVKDIACNILAFLRNSATKEGHTYWLYKGKKSGLVKLYDLTQLCGGSVPQEGTTPFTMPVGMLLYRVARRMRQSSDRFKIAEIKALLQNSLRLLDETKHGQVCTSSYYLLSDLYVPDSCIQNKWTVEKAAEDLMEESSESEDESEPEDKSEMLVEVKSFFHRNFCESKPRKRVRLEGINGTPDERCKNGLQYVRKGLTCLEHDLQRQTLKENQPNSSIVEEQQMCDPSRAIPLKYEPIHKENNCHDESLLQLSTQASFRGSWHQLSKALLLRKASMANYVLAAEFLANQQYGCSLKHVRYAIHCFESMARLIPSKEKENKELLMLLLVTAAEARYFLGISSKGLEEQQRGYDDMSEDDTYILDRAQSVVSVPEMGWVYKWTTNQMENLKDSVRCLERITELTHSERAKQKSLLMDVAKKMGSSYNELGKLAMARAEYLLRKEMNFDAVKDVWSQSKSFFERGVEGFHDICDGKNEGVVQCNLARLHRLAAQAYTYQMETSGGEFTPEMRHHLKVACSCFENALKCLGSNTRHGEFRDTILWDYSTCYAHMGILLQDFPPITTASIQEIAREVVDLLSRSIKLCSLISADSDNKILCPYRIATLEKRIASQHFRCFQDEKQEVKKKHFETWAENSYKRAISLFTTSPEWAYEMLECMTERLCLHSSIFQSQDKSASVKKEKMLEKLLLLITELGQPLKNLCECAENFKDSHDLQTKDLKGAGEMEDKKAKYLKLAACLLSSIQTILLWWLQWSCSSKKKLKGCADETRALKSLYNKSLHLAKEDMNCVSRVKQLMELVEEIRLHSSSQFS